MSEDVITSAVIRYIDHGAFPQSEDVASAHLTTDNLRSLLEELRKAQDEARDEIRKLSKETAPDIDTWISRAKELQADILRSRETARQVVAEAETGKGLKANIEDAGNKVQLLEKEVAFNETLTGTLEHIRFANGVLDEAQDAAVQGVVDMALDKLEDADESIQALRSVQSSSAYALLGKRAEQLRENMKETAIEYWEGFVKVDSEARTVTIKSRLKEDGLTLESLVGGTERLGIFEGLLGNLAKDLERTIFRSRMILDESGRVPNVKNHDGRLALDGKSEETGVSALLQDLRTIIIWLQQHLPDSVGVPLSEHLIPAIAARLENDWLEPAVPLEISEMASFQQLLDEVLGLADAIDQIKWHGSASLREWVKSAPRTWLTKRRETLLGDARNLVFTGLRERKTVERVETQMVSNDDALATSDEEENEWDTAWDEPDEMKSTPRPEEPSAEDDDEASAWDVEDNDEKTAGPDDEDETWGWGDGDQNAPRSPKLSKKEPSKVNGERPPAQPAEREMTLRETFMVTGLPDSLIELIQQIIADAQTLAGPEHASSLIAPAAAALYSLPTLALAVYRATAPTAYSKLDTGNMLIYNDASRLSDQLRSWQASQPPASRLRLDNDVKALDQFAKRAYSAEMESQRTILRDLLEEAQGFSNSTTNPFKAECESAVEQTVHRLREVHRQWTSILSPSALSQSIGSLLASVTGQMITEIEDLPDIGEAESRQLKTFCDAVSEVKDLFVQSAPDQSEARDLTFIYCPNWLKFQYLAEIMESSLADIKYLWHEGELSLEFDGEEVVGLIEALFADSALRRGAINEVRRS